MLDYTFEDNNTEDPEQVLPGIQAALRESGLEDQFSELFPMRLGYVRAGTAAEAVFTMDAVMDALRGLPQSEDRDLLLNNLSYVDHPYLICLSDYNRLLELAGEPTLALERVQGRFKRRCPERNLLRPPGGCTGRHPHRPDRRSPVHKSGDGPLHHAEFCPDFAG